jgi:peptidoglycan/LPS O-acetylase OafA/YrhL
MPSEPGTSMANASSGTSLLPQIDGLRGFAILAVLYQHGFSHGVARVLGNHGLFPYLQGNGWMGVSLFFLLSGFVLALGFVGPQRKPPDATETRRFYLRPQGACCRCSRSDVSSAISSIGPSPARCCSP